MSSSNLSITAHKRRRPSVSARAHPVDESIAWLPIEALVVNQRNSRRHPREQIP